MTTETTTPLKVIDGAEDVPQHINVFKCGLCPNWFNYSGALLFSPPNEEDVVKKIHVCGPCFEEITSDR